MAVITEAVTLDDEVFRAGRPVVVRGLVGSWPSVALSRQSPAALVEYLRGFDNGTPVDAIMTPPEVEGRVFYDEAMNGFNFLRNRLPFSAVAEQVLRYSTFDRPPAVAVQSALLRDCLPGFVAQNTLRVLEDIQPRIWFGNAITTPAHIDEWNNIGCVVSGRRRFTLFPPEQIANLYIGPLDFAPTGAPMSLVRLHDPDFARFPRFEQALASAVSAELAPGDAIYVPPLWWHHVESLEPFNMLVNYWWHASPARALGTTPGFDSLIHAILSLRQQPPATRAAWREVFSHFVFGDDADVTAHIPEHRHGILGNVSDADVARLRAHLAERLRK